MTGDQRNETLPTVDPPARFKRYGAASGRHEILISALYRGGSAVTGKQPAACEHIQTAKLMVEVDINLV
jgi:hypothetical protein